MPVHLVVDFAVVGHRDAPVLEEVERLLYLGGWFGVHDGTREAVRGELDVAGLRLSGHVLADGVAVTPVDRPGVPCVLRQRTAVPAGPFATVGHWPKADRGRQYRPGGHEFRLHRWAVSGDGAADQRGGWVSETGSSTRVPSASARPGRFTISGTCSSES